MATRMIFLEDHVRDGARPRLRLGGGTDDQRVWARIQPIDGVELLVEQYLPTRSDEATNAEIDRMFAACAANIYRPVAPSDSDSEGKPGA